MLAGLGLGGRPVWAQDGVLAEVAPAGNLVAIGLGPYPDYIGSGDYTIAGISSYLGLRLPLPLRGSWR